MSFESDGVKGSPVPPKGLLRKSDCILKGNQSSFMRGEVGWKYWN